MKQGGNLRLVIAALLLVYAMTLLAVRATPEMADTIEKLGNLIIGGLLAIMRPSSPQRSEPLP